MALGGPSARAARSSSSTTRPRKPGCSDRRGTPTTPRCRWIRSSPRSTRTWWDADGPTTSRARRARRRAQPTWRSSAIRSCLRNSASLLEAANAKQPVPFEFDRSYAAPGHPLQYYCRADHYNYARYGIPAVALSRGEHLDYHQVTDEAAVHQLSGSGARVEDGVRRGDGDRERGPSAEARRCKTDESARALPTVASAS